MTIELNYNYVKFKLAVLIENFYTQQQPFTTNIFHIIVMNTRANDDYVKFSQENILK